MAWSNHRRYRTDRQIGSWGFHYASRYQRLATRRKQSRFTLPVGAFTNSRTIRLWLKQRSRRPGQRDNPAWSQVQLANAVHLVYRGARSCDQHTWTRTGHQSTVAVTNSRE